MRDRLSTVESLLNEHEAIRGHMKQVRDSVSNLESLLVKDGNIPKQSELLTAAAEKQRHLIQEMGYLEDGLRNHHAHEDEVMPPLVGDLIMTAIRLEHKEQLEMCKKLNPLLTDKDIRHFSSQLTLIKKSIEDICQAASLHSIREDGILHFLRVVPE